MTDGVLAILLVAPFTPVQPHVPVKGDILEDSRRYAELLPAFYSHFGLRRMELKWPCFALQDEEINRASVDHG